MLAVLLNNVCIKATDVTASNKCHYFLLSMVGSIEHMPFQKLINKYWYITSLKLLYLQIAFSGPYSKISRLFQHPSPNSGLFLA